MGRFDYLFPVEILDDREEIVNFAWGVRGPDVIHLYSCKDIFTQFVRGAFGDEFYQRSWIEEFVWPNSKLVLCFYELVVYGTLKNIVREYIIHWLDHTKAVIRDMTEYVKGKPKEELVSLLYDALSTMRTYFLLLPSSILYCTQSKCAECVKLEIKKILKGRIRRIFEYEKGLRDVIRKLIMEHGGFDYRLIIEPDMETVRETIADDGDHVFDRIKWMFCSEDEEARKMVKGMLDAIIEAFVKDLEPPTDS